MRFNLKTTLAAALTAVTLAAAVTATPAAARDGRNGAFFGGLAVGGLLGGALAGGFRPRYEGGPYYAGSYYEAPDCWFERRPIYNYWGDVVRYRRVQICN